MAVAPVMAKPRTIGLEEIIDEYNYRRELFQDRDAAYETLNRYYRGDNNGKGVLPILSANAQGRPLLRPIGESINVQRTYSSQRLAPVVDDYSALMGRMPTTRVEPPDDSEQGEQRGELLTKYIYSTYELSRMGYQQAQSGFYLSCLGDSVYVLEPEGDLKRVVWNVCNPRTVYPSFYNGYRRFEVFDAIISEVWSRRDLRRQWGIDADNDNEENCTVLTYLSPYQRTVFVGTRYPIRASHVEWDLDFCPVVWVFNKVTGVMAMSDIAHSLEQQDFLDFCFNVWADGIVYMTYPMIGIKNPQEVGQDAPVIGPGAPPVMLHGDGDIVVRNTQADPRALEQIIAQTLQDINAATGTSDVRQQGQMKSSITTGRAVQSVQGPQSTRIEFKQQVLGEAIEAANRMTLAMQERAPVLKNFKGAIFGNLRGKSFQDEFDAAKDIDGWHRTKVTWQSLVGMNLQQKAAVAYEGLQAKLWDDIEAREIVGVEDPVGMRKRIEAQMMAEAELQGKMMQVQAGQQPGGQQGVPSQSQQGQSQQPAPYLFRPPQAAPQGGAQGAGPAAPPGGQNAPGPSSQTGLTEALSKIASTLKGSVWLAQDGNILISDSRDYSKVLEAVRAARPDAKVRQMAESKMPNTATRLV
jgi:hypothetical protein